MFFQRSRPSGPRRRWLGLAVPVALLVLAGCTSAAAPSPVSPAAPGSASTGSTKAVGAPVDLGAPAIAPVPGSGAAGSTAGGTGSANGSSGVMTYPFQGYAGTGAVAPDHTIVVVGSGQAPMKSDGSDRVAAERVAVAAALDDARVLADAAAHAAGVSITGVSSISVSVGESYLGVIPMTGVAEPNSVPGGPAAPALPVASPPTPALSVTVTVAYRIG